MAKCSSDHGLGEIGKRVCIFLVHGVYCSGSEAFGASEAPCEVNNAGGEDGFHWSYGCKVGEEMVAVNVEFGLAF